MEDSRFSIATITNDSNDARHKGLTKIQQIPSTSGGLFKNKKRQTVKEETLIDGGIPQRKEKLSIVVKAEKLIEKNAKRKDLTRIFGKPELPPSVPRQEKPKTKKKVVIKIHSENSHVSDSDTDTHTYRSKDLTKILGVPEETPDDSHDHQEALKIISNYMKEKQEQETGGKKILKNLVDSAKIKLRRAVKKINTLQLPEVESELESVEKRLSLQEQKRELEKQSHSLISVQFISDNIKSFFGETFFVEDSPVKVIDIIRTPTEEWPNLFETQHSSEATESAQFNPHYIRRMSNASEKTVSSETKLEHEKESEIERKPRGVDMDTILERIFNDNEFKRSIMVGQFPNQEVYPELFGDASDVEDSVNNDKADDASSICSFGTQTVGPSFNWTPLSHFRLEAHDEDFEPEHPLERENSEFCDLAELELLFERHKKLNKIKKELHIPEIQETKGDKQLQRLNNVLDEHHRHSVHKVLNEHNRRSVRERLPKARPETRGERQLRQLNAVLEKEQDDSYWKPLTRAVSAPFSGNTGNPFHPRHKSVSSINNYLSNQDCVEPDSIQEKSWDYIAGNQNGHKEFKKLIKYMFKSGKSMHNIETGQEMTVFDRYEYEEIWCDDEESPSCHSKDEDQVSCYSI
ncbi:hypothetical protein HDV01_003730 [Terramyces sp. JEL0728]|nr:hypothetical protein HDV01_003730 [Terramyces sp. JEL0728]